MKFKFFICFILAVELAKAQKSAIINNESTHFAIEQKNDCIDFIVVDTALTEKKPILLWCQGSLPVPLYIRFKKEGLWMLAGGMNNSDYQEIRKHYHLVVISMPKTPLIVDETEVNSGYWYYGDSPNKNIPSLTFQKADYLDNYVNRALTVIRFLRKQKWVDNSKLIIAGHSQGSTVATAVAKRSKNISALGLFSPNPLGRIDQDIRRYRKEAEHNKISWEQADKAIEAQYQFYRYANDPKKIRENPNLLSWNTFSNPRIDDWLALNKPIYLAYGSSDITSDLCDLVPLYFIREHKENLTYKRYLNLDHSFFEVGSDGKVNHQKPHWKEIISRFIAWTLAVK